MHGILIAVNPGTTTTRSAAYRYDGECLGLLSEACFEHSDQDLARFGSIPDQFDFRLTALKSFTSNVLDKAGGDRLLACAGRGGMLTPVPPGVIRVNAALARFSLRSPVYQHASNLGAPLVDALAQRYGCQAYIVDPVSVDELSAVARVTGSPQFERFSFVHALNIRATARKVARAVGRDLCNLRMVVAHLGAGFSIAAMDRGRIVDNSNRMECSPFTPERCGGLPPVPLIEACYSGEFSREEMLQRLYGEGGVFAYLGTRDIREVEAMIVAGNGKAKLVFDAMIYQIKKAIGAMCAAMNFDVQAIVLTGGLVNSERLFLAIESAVERIAEVHRFAGSNETEALATAALSALRNPDTVMEWPVASHVRFDGKRCR